MTRGFLRRAPGAPPSPRTPPAPPARPASPRPGDPAGPLREVRALGADVARAVSAWRDPWRRALAAPLAARKGQPEPPGPARRGAALHTAHPYLFHAAFPEVPAECVRELAVSDRLLTEHLLHCDRTLDRGGHAYPGLLFLAQAEQAAALRRLYRLLPPQAPFWPFFFQCQEETWRSVQEEWLHQCRGPGPSSLSHCLRLARGKTALLRCCTAALAFLAGRAHERHWVCEALDRHHEGLVLLDDLEDWREDFLRGNRTFLLARVLAHGGLAEEAERGGAAPLVRVADPLYRRGEAQEQLRRAEACFRAALETPAAHPLPLWRALNLRYLHRCRTARLGIASWRGRSAARPAPARAGREPAAAAAEKPVRVFLHPGVPPGMRRCASAVAARFQACFPACTPQALTLGRWQGLPGHFCLPGLGPVNCAVNLLPPPHPPAATVSRNPLRLEMVLALVTGARFLLHGPRRSLLEQLFVRGLGLEICRRLWPARPDRTWVRIPAPAWQWCLAHESYLWERVAPFLEVPPPTDVLPPGEDALPPDPLAPGPDGEGVRLFLGARFHAHVRSLSLVPGTAAAMARPPDALLRAARRYLQR